MKKCVIVILLAVFSFASLRSFGEDIYILTEEGEVINATAVAPQNFGLSPDDLSILITEENGELIIEKLLIEDEYIEEGGKVVMIKSEEGSYLQAYEYSWEEEDTEGIVEEGEEPLNIEE